MPLLFELGMFSKGFLVIENILESKEFFLTRTHTEELKRIVKPNRA
jgi:predicted GNAT superfamily acetyltransferase